jgi:hypothetical protein
MATPKAPLARRRRGSDGRRRRRRRRARQSDGCVLRGRLEERSGRAVASCEDMGSTVPFMACPLIAGLGPAAGVPAGRPAAEATGEIASKREMLAFMPAAAELKKVTGVSGPDSRAWLELAGVGYHVLLRTRSRAAKTMPACTHLSSVAVARLDRVDGCEECLESGDTWVHLRQCLQCGHVGCCDSSRNKHATRHFKDTGHPLVTSLERGELWIWCYVDQVVMESPTPKPKTQGD